MKKNVYLIESIDDFEVSDNRDHVLSNSFGEAANVWYAKSGNSESDITKITCVIRGVEVPVINFLSADVPPCIVEFCKSDTSIGEGELIYWDKRLKIATLAKNNNLCIGKCVEYSSTGNTMVRVRMGVS